MRLFRIVVFLLIFIFLACDHGLDPTEKESPSYVTAISGTIYYKNWPEPDTLENTRPDSVYDLRLVIFRDMPPADADSTYIINEVYSNRALIYPQINHLPYFIDSSQYFINCQPGVYEYLIIARQFGSFLQWDAVGHYDTTFNDSLPTSVEVVQDSILQNINFQVDFDSLPPQPF